MKKQIDDNSEEGCSGEFFEPDTYVSSNGVPEMGGQLWEECDGCGHEPIYMPLMLCEMCWPKKMKENK